MSGEVKVIGSQLHFLAFSFSNTWGIKVERQNVCDKEKYIRFGSTLMWNEWLIYMKHNIPPPMIGFLVLNYGIHILANNILVKN